MSKRVLSVGQCSYDHGNIATSLKELFGAEVLAAADQAEALERIATDSFALVLVNRIFDENGESGLDFIRRLKKNSSLPVMLVSNYEDAQQEAIAAGRCRDSASRR